VLAFLVVGTTVATALGLAAGVRILLPLLQAAVPFAVFLPRVRQGRPAAAAGWVLVWAVLQSLAIGAAYAVDPERTAALVIRGETYPQEMLHWIRTGVGAEGSPRRFLPMHAAHYLAFCAASFLTWGGAGLVLGTVLLDYMNVYVSTLVAASAHPWTAAAIGWPVWAVLRVVGFVLSGAALAAYGSARFERRPAPDCPRETFPRTLFLAGLGLVLADALLKAMLAPSWRRLLLAALGGSGD
jgi:hypothetical protein